MGVRSNKPAVPSQEQGNASYERAISLLDSSPLRNTAQRRSILAILAAEHGPFTAEEIHARMDQNSCDLVTVYRSLAALERAQIVRRCDFGDGALRHEIASTHHHHHIICRVCKSVRTLEHDCVAGVLEEVARKAGYSQVTHSLEIFGICPNCRKS